MAKINPVGIIGDLFKEVIKFFDMAYKEGYLLYLMIGMVLLLGYIIFFN